MNIRLVYAKIASAPQRVFTPNFTLEITPTSFKIKNKEDLRGSTFENDSEADARRFYEWFNAQYEQALKSLGFWELMESVKDAGIKMKRLSRIE